MHRDRTSKNKRCPAVESLEARRVLASYPVELTPRATALALKLHIAQSSSPAGDFVAIGKPRVTVGGRTTPGTVVQLDRVGDAGRAATIARTKADAKGHYSFSVRCKVGTTALVARPSGSSADMPTATLTITRANEAIVWNSVALQAVRTAHAQAPDAAREYAIVALSVYDAVNAISPGYASYAMPPGAMKGASADAAAATAAYTALVGLFPSQTAMLDAQLTASLASIASGPARARGVALGAASADQILALRSGDGSASKVAYNPIPGPDVWTPTLPAYAPPVDPQWGRVTPFALISGSQFQTPPPPSPTSTQFAADVAQVETVGGATSTARTADQTALAHFWSDLAGTFDPPGHWNQIAEIAAMARHSNLLDSARSLALVDMALADAGIEAWGVKFTYDTARPVTVIRDGLDGINPMIAASPAWTPLWSTPPFPSYVSGHSTFSAAAAAVLDSVYGTHFAFSDAGDPSLGLAPRHFATFDAAAQEAGISRIYGGIHYQSDNLAGLALGGEIGRYVVDHKLLPLRPQ